ncbi:MAG: hydrogenase formation protein HypD [Acidimicrobiales bacterium]|nr:hydrogenase formation protein HypD [Acidimicrobiales bacterium]
MKYVAEFGAPELAQRLLDEIRATVTQPWTLMEVCGGQTHAIISHGIDQLLPESVELVHGPGCPVCVTPLALIDQSLAIAARPEVIFCSFGDMLRVPGSASDLYRVRAEGGDVRVVYSPLDAVELAAANPDREVVFFGVGFETTAPANALAIRTARDRGLGNFSVLISHVLVPPAIEAIVTSPDCRVDAFLAAGHVCTVMGLDQYEPLAQAHGVPIIVTGFEPLDVLDGIRRALGQLERGEAVVENAYPRAVQAAGNAAARATLEDVFETTDRQWRGIGTIDRSGWRLRPPYRAFDAAIRFAVDEITAPESERCQAGAVLQGHIRPTECPAFGEECTPASPLGAPMVSAEGACAAYYSHRRVDLRRREGTARANHS